MKKVLCIALACMMLTASLCVNVSASVTTAVTYENDYETGTAKFIVPEAEGSENNVAYFVNIADNPATEDVDESFKTADSNGWVNDVADFVNGFAVEAKVKCLNKNGLSLFFEAYQGDGTTTSAGTSKGYYIPSSGLKENTWYNIRLVFKGGYYVSAVINEVGTNEFLKIGEGKGTLSTNSHTYTPEGSETSVTIKNYYNRARFICNGNYGPDGKYSTTADFAWMVDDVKFEKFAPVESEGVVWEQHYEDSTNTNHIGVAYAPGRDGGTAASYYAAEDKSIGNISYTLKAEEYIGANAVLTFDIKKMAPSGVFNVHAGTGTHLFKFGVPANQLRQGVWYTYVAVMENGNTSYWRKAEDSDVWQRVRPSKYGEEGIETLEAGKTTDVEVPLALYGSSNGNNSTTLLRMAIMYGATSYSSSTKLGSDFGNETIAGSHYLIDNYKLTKLGALEGIFADDATKLSTFAKPGSTTYVASFDESGRMIDADLTADIANFADIELTTEGADSIYAYVWSEASAPVSSWDITDYFTTAE